MKKYFVLVLISTILFSCNKPMSCKTSMSDFHQLFDDLVANGNKDEFHLDFEVHSYQFKVNSDKTICKIGYQSFDALENVKYTIEITDLTDNSDYLNYSQKFKSNKTSYITISSGFKLKAGHIYEIKRIQNNYGAYISNTIGRVAFGNIQFPISHNGLTILSSSFNGAASPSLNGALPFIDIVFAK